MNNTPRPGFSLIELMVVVLVISVLAAIAWPMYQGYTVRTHRTAGAACVAEAAQFMERFYTMNLRYDQDTGGAAVALPTMECATRVADTYDVAIATVSASAYTVSATPKGVQASRDTECGTLSVDNTGKRTVSGTKPANKCF